MERTGTGKVFVNGLGEYYGKDGDMENIRAILQTLDKKVYNFGPMLYDKRRAPKDTSKMERIEKDGYELFFYEQESISLNFSGSSSTPKTRTWMLYQRIVDNTIEQLINNK